MITGLIVTDPALRECTVTGPGGTLGTVEVKYPTGGYADFPETSLSVTYGNAFDVTV